MKRITLRVVHRGRRRHGCGIEILNLIRAKAVRLQPEGQIQHILIGCPGVASNKIRNQVLLFTALRSRLVKHGLEPIIRAYARLHHLG